MNRYVFRAKKDEKGFRFNEEKFREIAAHLRNGPYFVKIERVVARRSLPQNALYHKWIAIFSEYMGYLNPHDACIPVKRHLGYCKIVVNKLGDKEEVCQSSADMYVDEMGELMDKTLILAAEHGLQLPTPEDMEP